METQQELQRLGKELQRTIHNLEKICDAQDPPSDEVLDQLDALYEQQIDLIDAAINKASIEYANATQAMAEAAQKTQAAINDLTKLEHGIEAVAKAVSMAAKLLAA